ncbi:hypothetical protein [Acidiphilium sp.]
MPRPTESRRDSRPTQPRKEDGGLPVWVFALVPLVVAMLMMLLALRV